MRIKNRKNQPTPTDAGRRKRAGNRASGLTLRRILVPLDFSGKSRQALDTAIPLAERHGGKVALIHVVEPAYFAGEPGFAYLPVNNNKVIETARARLRETATQLIPPALRDQVVVREGSAYHQITAAARSLKADLIVIASQGHTGLSRVLLGSTAERVVRHAPCPVLAVRRH